MTKAEKQNIRKVLKNFDMIYSVSIGICKEFDEKAIPLPVLKASIGAAKIKPDESNKIMHDYIQKHNKVLDELYKTCELHVKSFGAEKVPFKFLRKCVDLCKREYAGAKEETKSISTEEVKKNVKDLWKLGEQVEKYIK